MARRKLAANRRNHGQPWACRAVEESVQFRSGDGPPLQEPEHGCQPHGPEHRQKQRTGLVERRREGSVHEHPDGAVARHVSGPQRPLAAQHRTLADAQIEEREEEGHVCAGNTTEHRPQHEAHERIGRGGEHERQGVGPQLVRLEDRGHHQQGRSRRHDGC